MDTQKILQVMQETFDSLERSGVLQHKVVVEPTTVILGAGSMLDSLGFVTFISDLEERISEATNSEVFLVLTEIHEFNTDQTALSAAVLASYIESITS